MKQTMTTAVWVTRIALNEPSCTTCGAVGLASCLCTDVNAAGYYLVAKIHKAAPAVDEQHCAVCGQYVKRVPGGHGPTWVHRDSGAVVAPNPPR